ncbi:MAG: Unknown protein [uncultured Sulfurovum sp.]|uniref:Uncharacterized protein n=1 Tax=uncultured Sulfurovum sp. TaxID=269237 RepID=A0A6S6SUU2_9BACT|nr:MAG: Unknown protein [uncultured Sulfurovum sp.]
MKKIFIFLLIILAFLAFFSFFIFHDKGNDLIKPYLADYLKSKSEQNISLEIQHLKIDLKHLEIKALLNELTQIEANGKISLITQSFNLDYTLKSNGFKNEQISFNNKIDINGTVIGTLNNMKIKGEGETLKSHINYAFNIKNDLINDIQVKINKADIASLLQLASQPAYARGKVDINIDIPTFEKADTKGKAKITLYKTFLNEKIFKQEFNIDLAKETSLTANLESKVSAEVFEFEGNIKSNLAWLKLSNTSYHVKNKKLTSNYKLLVPKLSKLIFLTQQKLRGQLQLMGELTMDKHKLLLNGISKDLEGTSSFNYNGKKLMVKMQQVDMAKFLYMMDQKPYATGKILAHIQLDDLKKLRGNYSFKTLNTQTINNTFKKDLNLDFTKNMNFSLESKGDIASNLIQMENALYTDIFQYHSSNMIYNLVSKKLTSAYNLEIPKLSKLNELTNQKLQGTLTINGNIDYANNVQITGLTQSLGGNINFKLIDQILSAKIAEVPVVKLMHTFSYPVIFKAPLTGDFYYDLNSRQGSLNSTLNKAQLLENELTMLIKQLRGIDLTKERYNESHFNAILNKNIIDLDFQAKSKQVLFLIPTGQINTINNSINANYSIKVDNKDMGGKIQGNITTPQITIDSSNYLKNKVNDIIKNNISEDTFKDLGLDKIQPDTIKNILGDLFK